VNPTFFQQHIYPIRHKLFRFALRITGQQQDAEDVVQEVLEKVWRTDSEQSANIKNWEAWCMTMTRNRSVDKSRASSSRRPVALENAVELETPAISVVARLELQEAATRIRELMQTLPEKQRLVMHLRDVEELTYEEIAETLQISLDQVKVNLHRARKSIRDAMSH
jgi:RNA polymerase sigma factor (sigma-70 family)